MSHENAHSLKWISLYEDPLMAIIPKDFETPEDGVFPIEKLVEYPFIISAAGVDYDIHKYLKEAGVTPDIRFSSKDDLAIVSMVANHLGISILPKLTIEGCNNDIQALPLKPFASRELGIGIHTSSSLSPAAGCFIQTIQKVLPELT